MLYKNLVEAMKKENVTKTDIARLLNIHFNTVTAKIDGETTSEDNKYQLGFTFIEAVVLQKTLFKSYDINWLFEFEGPFESKSA